ncbi:hypothetical protein HL658_18300 [Azospirillum sp. RWY-5-1]|uniref:CobQ/CobB/MinD/ParA nucleotide binding domain-containing protein n=1 Tax=Azospirillum oleiclasticum TaxID=2735135 RepID=A0ABX2TFW5_9PROT|nr:hypothetical protein [Azospirillum oleiclasticum]NYZ14505.1 hypothetical protein [Azospirillum oleiclasticum]NYZ23143.1 hypothetical protein [Azospirillum oleiclasticum]
MATIVCVVGDKGGTGKSTWARGLAELYRLHEVRAALFDGDWLARSLFKFFRVSEENGRTVPLDRQDPRRGCMLYDARDRRFGRDLLLNSMAMPGVETILHDLPAGFRTDLTSLLAASSPSEAVKEFEACARSMGHALVLVNVITPSPSDFHTAPWLAEALAGRATVVAVRNGLFDAETFAVWTREAGKAFADAGGIEIEMPRLDTAAAILCDQKLVRFAAAATDERIALADRMRILSWLRRFAESVAPLAGALRLPADVGAATADRLRVAPSPAEPSEPPRPDDTPPPERTSSPERPPETTAVAAGLTPVAKDEPRPPVKPAPQPRRLPPEAAARRPQVNGSSVPEDRFLLPIDMPIV